MVQRVDGLLTPFVNKAADFRTVHVNCEWAGKRDAVLETEREDDLLNREREKKSLTLFTSFYYQIFYTIRIKPQWTKIMKYILILKLTLPL